MAQVHYELGPFGKAVCGKENVDTTRVTDEVSCMACRRTEAFAGHLEKLPPSGDPAEETPR